VEGKKRGEGRRNRRGVKGNGWVEKEVGKEHCRGGGVKENESRLVKMPK